MADIEKGPRIHELTGTWQFISTLLLRKRGKCHWLQDDLESFVLLVLYHGLRYTRHNKITRLSYIMRQVFDESFEDDGFMLGGECKYSMFVAEAFIGEDLAFTDNPALTQWIQSALKAVKQWIIYAKSRLAERRDRPFHPSDGPTEELELRDHEQLAQAFDIALSQSWPTTDEAVDNLLDLDARNLKRVADGDPEGGSGSLPKRAEPEVAM